LTTLRVAVPAGSFVDLPTWIAQRQGYFRKMGLDVKATISSIPFSQQPEALGREYDLIVGSQPDLINAAARGIDLVAVSGNNHDSPTTIPGAVLVVPKGSSISSISALNGKSVGSPSITGNNWLSLLCWAQKSGVDPKSIRGLQAPAPQIPELIFQPLLNQALKNGGVALGDSYAHCFGMPQFSSLWLANGAWVRAHGKTVAAFLAGLTAAKQYMLKHPSETRAVFVARSGLPAAVAAAVPIDPRVFQFGPLPAADLQPWLALMKRFLGFSQSVDLQKLVSSA
jgi:NitT/TauT family transport system substrate-binding protein